MTYCVSGGALNSTHSLTHLQGLIQTFLGDKPEYQGAQGCARGLFSLDRGETEILKPETEPETELLTIQVEARPRPRPSELETETRPKRTNSKARPSRGTTAPPRNRSVKTEATSLSVTERSHRVLRCYVSAQK